MSDTEAEQAFWKGEGARELALEVIEDARKRGLIGQAAYLDAVTIWRDAHDPAGALLHLLKDACGGIVVTSDVQSVEIRNITIRP